LRVRGEPCRLSRDHIWLEQAAQGFMAYAGTLVPGIVHSVRTEASEALRPVMSNQLRGITAQAFRRGGSSSLEYWCTLPRASREFGRGAVWRNELPPSWSSPKRFRCSLLPPCLRNSSEDRASGMVATRVAGGM
jgi:hypothetical protein